MDAIPRRERPGDCVYSQGDHLPTHRGSPGSRRTRPGSDAGMGEANPVRIRGPFAMSDAQQASERLFQSARAGSAEAIGELLEAYRAYLGLLARVQIGRRLQGKADPSDLVQETFLAAHQHFAEFRGTGEAELLAWLRQIMASKLSDLVRRYVGAAGRAVHLEQQIGDELDRSSRAIQDVLVAPGNSPSQLAARREESVVLAEALERLPEDYREVLVLRHMEELSFPEIAGRMDRTLDSVKNLWTRALARLKQSLRES